MQQTYTEAEVHHVAKALIESVAQKDAATIVGLSGDLGAGKTTLVKAIAEVLGVQETVASPTFVIAKYYPLATGQWKQLVHMDAYRIEDPAEVEAVDWQTLITSPETLLIVEWPERILEKLPPTIQRFHIEHVDDDRAATRIITAL